MFFALTVTLYVVLGVKPVMVCLYTPGFTVLAKTKQVDVDRRCRIVKIVGLQAVFQSPAATLLIHT